MSDAILSEIGQLSIDLARLGQEIRIEREQAAVMRGLIREVLTELRPSSSWAKTWFERARKAVGDE